MTREEVLCSLQEIFRDVFDDESIIIKESTTAADIEDWDSFEQVNLIVAIEKRFNKKFDVKEMSSMKNVGDMITLIARDERGTDGGNARNAEGSAK